MTSIQHAMNILGHCAGVLTLNEIKPGFTATKVQWNGCMADVKRTIGIGTIIRSEKLEGKYDGTKRWEAADNFRKLSNGELEIW